MGRWPVVPGDVGQWMGHIGAPGGVRSRGGRGCGAPGDAGPGAMRDAENCTLDGLGGPGGCGGDAGPALPSPAMGRRRRRRRRRRGCPARAGLKRHVTGARGCRGPAGARAAASSGAAPLDGASRRGAGERWIGGTGGSEPGPWHILVGGFVVRGRGGGQ